MPVSISQSRSQSTQPLTIATKVTVNGKVIQSQKALQTIELVFRILISTIVAIAWSIFCCPFKKAKPIDAQTASVTVKKDRKITSVQSSLRVHPLPMSVVSVNTRTSVIQTPKAPPNTPASVVQTPKAVPNTLFSTPPALKIIIPDTSFESSPGESKLVRNLIPAELIGEEDLRLPLLTELPKDRAQPPHGARDTHVFSPKTGLMEGRRTIKKVFMNNEIKLPIIPASARRVYRQAEMEYEVFLTSEKRHLLQQQSLKFGSYGACLAMLILDRGKIPNFSQLRDRIQDADIYMQSSSVTPIIGRISKGQDGIEKLAELIHENGAACIEIDTLWAHFIIVDDINIKAGTAKIRDPYHNWAPTITLSALESKLKGGRVIQA
jgi:hypothetical protein